MKIHPLITDSAELAALVDRLAAHDFVAVDTEFMRENTYWPELCLIQIASVDEAAAIDPLADGLDLKPLWDHAGQWGAAIRLAQRLSGGTEKLLARCRVALEEDAVLLRLARKDQRLYSDIVARRHRQLASSMGLAARVELS